ncbi:MAG TPA: flagellar motor switch protein FliM [Candidatus Goldiibacteriota bacterium]|nr:flagellar motor switch protein FliM [Candidatus Goldiibacteriota bacterium]HRQ43916.1 flagellar motor switch protein FliM [Candidatus Goldiibacteriota bacterium]
MADDILSDGELDALLSDMKTGPSKSVESDDEDDSAEAGPKSPVKKKGKIKVYDFRRPDKFSKDQVRTIEMMHEGFARHFGADLSGYIRAIAEVTVTSVKQMTYSEYIERISNPTSIAVFAMEPLKGAAIYEINPSIIFPIIDRVLGGAGEAMSKPRELTDLEQAIVSKLIEKAFLNLKDSWHRIVDFDPEIKARETNPQFVQIVAPNEMCLNLNFEIKIKEHVGSMSICIPYLVIEPVLYKLSAKQWFTLTKEELSEETKDILDNRVKNTWVPLSVNIGTATLAMKDIINLKKGDIVKLETNVNDDILVLVETKPMFYAKVGAKGKKKAVKVTGLIKKADESYEKKFSVK